MRLSKSSGGNIIEPFYRTVAFTLFYALFYAVFCFDIKKQTGENNPNLPVEIPNLGNACGYPEISRHNFHVTRAVYNNGNIVSTA